MSQRDLVAELRAAHVEAPPEVRERVRLIAAAAPAPRRRITWRRALVVALPVAAAVAAAVVVTRPAHHRSAQELQLGRVQQHGAAASGGAVHAAAPNATSPKALVVPPSTPSRVQAVDATLGLRIPTATGVSDAVKRAARITASLGGYTATVNAHTSGHAATADLTLKIPRTNVQTALSRLSGLGTITEEQVSVTDLQGGLNATERLVARLQKHLAALRAQHAPARRIAALTSRVEALQRSEAETRRTAHYATIGLHLGTPAPPAPRHHRKGPLHGVGVALTWLGIGAVYALAIGGPVLVLLALVWLAVRLVRRRRVDSLLSRS